MFAVPIGNHGSVHSLVVGFGHCIWFPRW